MMTPKKTDIRARKERVLGITVSQYIKNVSPVSSAFLVNEYFADLSSATIRNILSELEQEGYLTHPHTSAGRIPTQKGYRYYVDNLVDEIQLLEEEKERIRQDYLKEKRELDALLKKASQAISQVTHYTGIVSVDGFEDRLYLSGTHHIVEYPDYQDIQKIRSILVALEEKEQLYKVISKELDKRIEVFIGSEIECSDIDACSLVVSSYKTRKGPTGRIAVLGPTSMDYQKVFSTVDYMTRLMEEMI